MGILNSNSYPRPSSWDEFENMIFDIYSAQYPYMAVNRCGRQGQDQHGLDVIVYNTEFRIGIQCKNVSSLTPRDVDEILRRIEPDVTLIVIATTTPRDMTTLNYVMSKSVQLQKTVKIEYWEDTVNALATHNLLKKYYPQFFAADGFSLEKDRNLFALFIQDFRGTGLRGYLDQLQANFKISDEAMSLFFLLEEKWSQVDFMFHNQELEIARLTFINGVDELTSLISLSTWGCGEGQHCVPVEWITEQPERYRETVGAINMQLSLFTNQFNQMLFVAKKNGIY